MKEWNEYGSDCDLLITVHTGTMHPGRCSLVQAALLGPDLKQMQILVKSQRWVSGQECDLMVVDEDSLVQQTLFLCRHHKIVSLILRNVN